MAPTVPADPPSFVRLVAHPLRWRLVTELARSDLRVRELVGLVGEPQNLVSYHLRLLRHDGLVTATRSTFDGRDSYYHLDLDHCARGLTGTGAAIHPALELTPREASGPGRVSVLFACTGNSARSPIAEALLRHHTAGRVKVTSGGSSPKPAFHPNAVRVLEEQYGVDIAGRTPRSLNTLTGRHFEHVITLCDKVREVCPEFGDPSRRTHWSIPDPGDAGYPVFQRIAAEIDTRIRYLLPVLALES
ncbi:ArsR family transcriptional regulator [Kribbella qitaiheensis]|uniref:arsenate reductase/protein-tyrosine-phosphatase family protein n=1 Tax=Kribbella qitaiheensis TaxID=1544730 RepID=UPI0036082978